MFKGQMQSGSYLPKKIIYGLQYCKKDIKIQKIIAKKIFNCNKIYWEFAFMLEVSATELKTEFKEYASLASEGKPVLIKRPKKEMNLVLINEAQFRQSLRIMEYYAKLFGYKGVDELMNSNAKDVAPKYGKDFLDLFGSLDDSDIERPDQGDYSSDAKREAL